MRKVALIMCGLCLSTVMFAASTDQSAATPSNSKAGKAVTKKAMCAPNGACSQLAGADGSADAIALAVSACKKECGDSSSN